MATLELSSVDFTRGKLPEVCALTGADADNRYRLVGSGRPAIAGAIPLSRRAALRIQRQRFSVAGLFVLALIAFLGGLATAASALLVGSAVLAILALSALVRLRKRGLTAKAVKAGEGVVLYNVHPDFVQAVNTPPAHCAGCPGHSTCSVTAMEVCDGSEQSQD